MVYGTPPIIMIDFLKQAVGFQINLKGFLGIMIGKRIVTKSLPFSHHFHKK
jgi:hypothetical protein